MQTIWRWRWIPVSIVGITILAIGLASYSADPTYRTKIKLQITTPVQEEVTLFDERRYANDRDAITIARNNLEAILTSSFVRNMTIDFLDLEEADQEFEIEVVPIRDADFLDVFVSARAPELAAEIANGHIEMAIQRMGKLRALPSISAIVDFEEQLEEAKTEMSDAEARLIVFQVENKITDLNVELGVNQQTLEQLELERNNLLFTQFGVQEDLVSPIEALIAERREELDPYLDIQFRYNSLLKNVVDAEEAYQELLTQYLPLDPVNSAPESLQAAAENIDLAKAELDIFLDENHISAVQSEITLLQTVLEQLNLERDQRILAEPKSGVPEGIVSIDALIVEQRILLEQLSLLEPEFNFLLVDVQQTRSRYELISGKYNEAQLKADTVLSANFIQIIAPAIAPSFADSSLKSALIFGFVGSLGFSLLLIFVLDYLVGIFTTNSQPEMAVDIVEEEGSFNVDKTLNDPVFNRPQISPKSTA